MLNSIFPFWTYVKLRHFFKYPNISPDWHRRHTPFETFCNKPLPQLNIVSFMYALLFSNQEVKTNGPCLKWEQNLNITLTEEDWDHMLHNIHKGSVKTTIQESAYKLQASWYLTPIQLSKFSPTSSLPLCWRCGNERGTLLHIWWTCSKKYNPSGRRLLKIYQGLQLILYTRFYTCTISFTQLIPSTLLIPQIPSSTSCKRS